MRYEGLIDTVSDIVKTYGVGILSDSKFWNILTDTYSFVGEYSLKDSFKDFLSNGNIKELIKLKGRRKETLIRIDKVLTQIKKIAPSKTPEISAILFSVSIAIGSCKKLDYEDYLNGRGNPRPKQGKKPNTKQITYYSAVYLRTILGVITLVGGTLLYGWFLLGEASMFWIVCLIGLMQLGTLKIVDEYLHCKVPDDKKIRILSCFIPIILGYIINSIVPIFLCFDDIAENLYQYFSADFIPDSYYIQPDDRPWYAPRISPEVGFFGGLASFILCISLISCAYRLISFMPDLKHKIKKNDIIASFIAFDVIVLLYIPIAYYPVWSINKQRKEYEKIETHNKELRKQRENTIQELSIKGIKLGISSETAWEYLNSIKEDRGPSKLHYSEKIKHPETLYDEFIGTSYNKVYPYDYTASGFEGVSISGDDYRMLITLDNETIGIDLYIYDGLVTVMRIYGLEHNNALSNFESLLSLYKTKYGEPEIIKDYSKARDIYSSYSVLSKGPGDKYVWNFKNGRIEITKYGVMYISEALLSKLRKECSDGIRESQIENKRKEEAARRQIEQEEILLKEQIRNDSIQRTKNHENAINEI